MPYAANGQISTSPIAGGIEITDQQYAEALAGMVEGKLVSIDGGFAVIDPPEPEVPPAPDPATPQPRTVFAPREYLKRFTMDEYAAARTGPIAVQYALDNLIGAQFVYLADPDVVAGLDVMVQAGIIDTTRKAELLQPEPAE